MSNLKFVKGATYKYSTSGVFALAAYMNVNLDNADGSFVCHDVLEDGVCMTKDIHCPTIPDPCCMPESVLTDPMWGVELVSLPDSE